MSFSSGLAYALLAMLGFGLGDAISKVPSRQFGPEKTIFYRNIFSLLFLSAIFIFFFRSYNFSFSVAFLALLIGLIGYLPLLSFYRAMKSGKVGVIAPIANSSLVFTTLFSLAFYHETLSIMQLISIIIVFAGMILVSVDFNDFKNSDFFSFSSGIPYALLTCFLWGLVFFLSKIPITFVGPFLTALLIEIGVLIMNFAHMAHSKIEFSVKAGHAKKLVAYSLLLGFFGAAGSLFSNLAIENYKLSIVSAIVFANPVVSAIYGNIVYRERLLFKEVAAVFFMVFGVVLISYFS